MVQKTELKSMASTNWSKCFQVKAELGHSFLPLEWVESKAFRKRHEKASDFHIKPD